MGLTLTDVSKQQLRKAGFLCSSVVINKDMILLFQVDKDVILDNHNHPHTQLGYCFNGRFDFEAEGEHFDVRKGHSYLLGGRVYHSAVASTDYYSMDIKIMIEHENLSQRMFQNVFEDIREKEDCTLTSASIGRCRVEKMTYFGNATADVEIDLSRKHFIVVSDPCILGFGMLSKDLYVEPMKIYQLEVDKAEFGITANKDVEVLLITYQ